MNAFEFSSILKEAAGFALASWCQMPAIDKPVGWMLIPVIFIVMLIVLPLIRRKS